MCRRAPAPVAAAASFWRDRVAVVSGKLRWTLVTADGETALRFEESLLDAARLDETAPHLAAIAARAARRIAAALEPPAADDGVARTASPVVLEGVRGAPGDGGIALARAMRHSLARIGIAVADDMDREARLISGRVSVLRDDTASDDATVTIAWNVMRPDGKRLGTVTQSNRVSVERLTGAWGALARIVARAGAPGIAQLLGQTEASRVAEAPRRWTPAELPFRTPAETSPSPTQSGDRGSARASDRIAHRSAHRARGRSAFRAIHADYRGAGCAARTARRGTAQAAVQAAALAAFQAAARGADRGLDRGLRSGSVTSFTGQGQIDTVRAPSGPVARPGRFHPVLYFREP